MANRRRSNRIWFVMLGVFVAVFLFTFLAQKFKNDNEVGAANMAAFDPGYIISDYQMSNYNSMNEAQIQQCRQYRDDLLSGLSRRGGSGSFHKAFFRFQELFTN